MSIFSAPFLIRVFLVSTNKINNSSLYLPCDFYATSLDTGCNTLGLFIAQVESAHYLFMFIYRKKQSYYKEHTSHCCSGWFPQDGLLGFWRSLWRHSCRSWRRKAITGTYPQPSIFQKKWRQRRWWRWQGRALVWQLSRSPGWLAVQVHLPVFNVIPHVTVGAVAVVLHFLTEPHPLPRSRLGAPLLLSSVHQGLHHHLLQAAVGYAAHISVGDAAGPHGQAPVPQQGAISLDWVGQGRQPGGLITLDRSESGWRRRWVGFPQHGEDGRGVSRGLDEGSTAPHLHLLQAGRCGAAGAAVQCVCFGAVCHLILQLQITCQCVDLVNHLHNSQSENSEKSTPRRRHRKTKPFPLSVCPPQNWSIQFFWPLFPISCQRNKIIVIKMTTTIMIGMASLLAHHLNTREIQLETV